MTEEELEIKYEDSLSFITSIYVKHMNHLGFFHLTEEQMEKLTIKLNEELKFRNDIDKAFIGIIDNLKDNYKL